MNDQRLIETSFHIPKLTLLEIFPLYPFLMRRPKLDCIEVGGNVGLWCEAFHNVFGDRIESFEVFEPMPKNVERFRQRLSQHMPSVKHVHIHQACAGDRAGDVTIHYHRDVTAMASVVVEHLDMGGGNAIVNDKSMTVPQVALDDVVDRPIDLVKVDVEGYEWQVMQGAGKVLDLIDNIYFEFGRHQQAVGQTFKQFFDFLIGQGYSIYQQEVGRNYFGLNAINRYDPVLENKNSMKMLLATRKGPNPEYRGPRVVGRVN